MRNNADDELGALSFRLAISPLEGEMPDRAEGGILPRAAWFTPLCHFVTSPPQGGRSLHVRRSSTEC
jgi:hypothetical protein